MTENQLKQPIVEILKFHSVMEARCGNSSFSDDIWDFTGYVEAPHWNAKSFLLDFTKFNEWESIKITVKEYIYSELLMVTFNSVKRKLIGLKPFIDYIKEKPEITSFKNFTENTLRDFFEYLLTTNSVRGTPLSPMSIKKSAQVIKEILIRGGQRGWEVPKNNVKTNLIYEELILQNKKIKDGTKFGRTNKILPTEEVINNLVDTALKQIEMKEDVLTSASILLSSQLGLRISEVVSLKKGCLSVINGEFQLSYFTSKTQKTRIQVQKPANEIVVKTIRALEEYAEPLIKKYGEPFLFLTETRREKDLIAIASYSNWTARRLTPFIKKNDIRDKDGNLVKLTHHYFRHIFATYAFKNGMKVHDVAEIMNHKSIMMTEIYDHTKGQKQEVIKEMLCGDIAVTSTNKIVLESLDSDENPFKGLTVNQVDNMRKALKIELLPHGMCLHHPMRGEPCDQDGVCLGCHQFIASEKHLPIYKTRLGRVKSELEKLNNDNNIYSTKLRFQEGMLEKYVSDLEIKVSKKESKNSF